METCIHHGLCVMQQIRIDLRCYMVDKYTLIAINGNEWQIFLTAVRDWF